MKSFQKRLDNIRKRISQCCCSNVVYNDEVLALVDAIQELKQALQEIGDGISPIGGICTPDGHRRRIANTVLKKVFGE